MSETKWTPGPWGLDPGESFKIKDAKKNSLAAVMFVHLRGRRDPDEVAANAHLIAAAPELYEALEEMVAMSALLPAKIVRLNRQYVDPKEAVARARAALAKARGETS